MEPVERPSRLAHAHHLTRRFGRQRPAAFRSALAPDPGKILSNGIWLFHGGYRKRLMVCKQGECPRIPYCAVLNRE